MKRFLTFTLIFLCLTVNAYALQVVSPTAGETTSINISIKDLNVIKTPFKSVKAFSSSPDIEVNIEGSNVLIKFTGSEIKTKDLVITDDKGNVYPLILVPSNIPLEVIKLDIKETGEDDEIQSIGSKLSTSTYINTIKSLVKSMYLEKMPMGYSVENLNKDITEWNEVKKVLKKRYRGPHFIGEVYELTALTDNVVLSENEFYTKGIIAVSIDLHNLKKDESTKLYIVRKK